MLLEAGGADVSFATRPVNGVDTGAAHSPTERLILDGQQRLTSLFQSLASGRPVQTQDTRKKRLERWFYIDMEMALDPDGDREQAIIAIPPDKVVLDNFGKDVLLDLSTTALECQREMFPLASIFDSPAVDAWMVAYLQLDKQNMATRLARWSRFKEQVLANFTSYTVPVIVPRKETPREAVCTVFEKVNTGGVVLDVFELLTATFAASEFDLRADWEARKKRLSEHKVLRGMQSTDFLQAVTLLATRQRRLSWKKGDSERPPAVSCKRGDILRLTREEYELVPRGREGLPVGSQLHDRRDCVQASPMTTTSRRTTQSTRTSRRALRNGPQSAIALGSDCQAQGHERRQGRRYCVADAAWSIPTNDFPIALSGQASSASASVTAPSAHPSGSANTSPLGARPRPS